MTRWKTRIMTFIRKYQKDNVGALAAIVAWNVLTSIVPIVVGLIAISGLVLRNSPGMQSAVISHLSSALQGVLTPKDLRDMVNLTVQHTGLLGVIGFVGVLWGGANVGGALSTAFQAIFETNGRNFVKEKLIDIGMIFVLTALMLIIIAGTTAGAILGQLVSNFPLSGPSSFIIGTAASVAAGFLLFSAIYLAFPNIKPHFRLGNVWRGGLVAAVLFEILSYIWPVYSHFAHFNRYGAVLFPILVLTAWIYFFSMITLLGAEIVAISAIDEAKARGEAVGPDPTETVPQHVLLREQRPRKEAQKKTAEPSPTR